MRITTPITPLLMALLLAACGGGKADDNAQGDAGETTASTEAHGDPCSYVTPEQMAAITTDKVQQASADGDTCTYRSNPDDGVRLVVATSDGAHQMEIARRAAGLLNGIGESFADKTDARGDAAAMMKKDGSAAPKLGDEAMWGMNSTLSVRRGDAYVEVTPPIIHDPANHTGYPLVGNDEKRAIAQKVAAAVLAKLPG